MNLHVWQHESLTARTRVFGARTNQCHAAANEPTVPHAQGRRCKTNTRLVIRTRWRCVAAVSTSSFHKAIDSNSRRVLQWSRCTERVERVHGRCDVEQGRRVRHRPPDTPACHRQQLRSTTNCDGALTHPGQQRDRHVSFRCFHCRVDAIVVGVSATGAGGGALVVRARVWWRVQRGEDA